MMGLRADSLDTIFCTLQVTLWILHAHTVENTATTPDSGFSQSDEIFLCYLVAGML